MTVFRKRLDDASSGSSHPHRGRRPVVDYAGLRDEDLLLRVRDGDTDAYGELWIRHERAATALARSLSPATADDLVAEAFTKVLRLLQMGKGPRDGFRAYLNTCIRTLNVDALRRDGRIVPLEDEELISSFVTTEDDEPDLGDNGDYATEAWKSLSKRDRWMTWATAVEGYSTAEIAHKLDVRPGTAAVWVHRARSNLRCAFVDQHVAGTDVTDCKVQRRRFATYLRGRLSEPRQEALRAHLSDCEDCRAVLAEAAIVNTRLRAVGPLLPLVGVGLLAKLIPWHHGAAAAPKTPGKSTLAQVGIVAGAAAGGIGAAVAVGVMVAAAMSSPEHRTQVALADRPSSSAASLLAPATTTPPSTTPTSSVPTTPPHTSTPTTPTRTTPALPRTTRPQTSTPPSTPASTPPTTPTDTPTSSAPTTPSSPTSPPILTGTVTFSSIPVVTGSTITVTLPSGWTVTSCRHLVTDDCTINGNTAVFDLSDVRVARASVSVDGTGPAPGGTATAVASHTGFAYYWANEQIP